jgi:hypothetical protein
MTKIYLRMTSKLSSVLRQCSAFPLEARKIDPLLSTRTHLRVLHLLWYYSTTAQRNSLRALPATPHKNQGARSPHIDGVCKDMHQTRQHIQQRKLGIAFIV